MRTTLGLYGAKMAKIRTWKYVDLAAVALLVLTVTLTDIIWRSLEPRPPHWDMGRHLWDGMSYLAIAQGHHWYAWFTQYMYYPPFVYWVSVPFIWAHPSMVTAVASNSVFIAVLALSTYGLGRRLWNRQTGLLATVFVMAAPIVASQFKDFQLDAPTLAMATLGLYLLVKTEYFSNRRFSIWFGVVVGFGLLTKWTYLFPLLLPIIYTVAVAGVQIVRTRRWHQLGNAALTLVPAYIIALPWYLVNQQQIRLDLLQNGVRAGANEGDPIVGSMASNVWYLQVLSKTQLDLILLIFLVAGLVGLAFHRYENLRRNAYPVLTIISTIVIFTLLRNKDVRYTMPMLSSVAVVATYWISQLSWRRIRLGLTVFLSAYCGVLFWLTSFGIGWLPQPTFSVGWLPVQILPQHGYITGPPSHERWYQEDAFKVVAGCEPDPQKRGLASLLSGTIWLNGYGSYYYSDVYNVPLVSVDKAHYLLEQVPAGTSFNSTRGATLRHYALPDGSSLYLVQLAHTPAI